MAISIDKIDFDFFEKISSLIDDNIDNFLMYEEFRKLVRDTYPSRILYGLSKLEFSAYWELSTLLAIPDNKTLQIAMSDLIRKGFVRPIYITSEKYSFILKFWKTIYRRSSHPPAFYELNKNWIEFIEKIQCILIEDFKGSSAINFEGIDLRISKYKQFCRKEKAELEKIEEIKKNSVGKCVLCDTYIPKSSEIGVDYGTLYGQLLHKRCERAASKPTLSALKEK